MNPQEFFEELKQIKETLVGLSESISNMSTPQVEDTPEEPDKAPEETDAEESSEWDKLFDEY